MVCPPRYVKKIPKIFNFINSEMVVNCLNIESTNGKVYKVLICYYSLYMYLYSLLFFYVNINRCIYFYVTFVTLYFVFITFLLNKFNNVN